MARFGEGGERDLGETGEGGKRAEHFMKEYERRDL